MEIRERCMSGYECSCVRDCLNWNRIYGIHSLGGINLFPKNWSMYNVRVGPKKGGETAKKRHKPEQLVNKLREAEVATSECSTMAVAARRIGVAEQSF